MAARKRPGSTRAEETPRACAARPRPPPPSESSGRPSSWKRRQLSHGTCFSTSTSSVLDARLQAAGLGSGSWRQTHSTKLTSPSGKACMVPGPCTSPKQTEPWQRSSLPPTKTKGSSGSALLKPRRLSRSSAWSAAAAAATASSRPSGPRQQLNSASQSCPATSAQGRSRGSSMLWIFPRSQPRKSTALRRKGESTAVGRGPAPFALHSAGIACRQLRCSSRSCPRPSAEQSWGTVRSTSLASLSATSKLGTVGKRGSTVTLTAEPGRPARTRSARPPWMNSAQRVQTAE
mmetsp:Transcript_79955/g.242712  ORF Transcript_79955/g.242712 Transcript_79955/m.242712 type:complete len:290 (+) Transcript_79955:186-1055(+)